MHNLIKNDVLRVHGNNKEMNIKITCITRTGYKFDVLDEDLNSDLATGYLPRGGFKIINILKKVVM